MDGHGKLETELRDTCCTAVGPPIHTTYRHTQTYSARSAPAQNSRPSPVNTTTLENQSHILAFDMKKDQSNTRSKCTERSERKNKQKGHKTSKQKPKKKNIPKLWLVFEPVKQVFNIRLH